MNEPRQSLLDFEFDDSLDIFETAGVNKIKKDVAETVAVEYDATMARQYRRSSKVKRYSLYMYRRAYSETQLIDLHTEPFREGYTYHYLTNGDVDTLSYLKIILREHSLDYLLFSTWCIAQEDIFQLADLYEDGKLNRIDAYVGDIVPSNYKAEYALLVPFIDETGGKTIVHRNHSKCLAGYSEKDNFYFVGQGSSNLNTNPRMENFCISIDRELFNFYKDYYDSVENYVRPSRRMKAWEN